MAAVPLRLLAPAAFKCVHMHPPISSTLSPRRMPAASAGDSTRGASTSRPPCGDTPPNCTPTPAAASAASAPASAAQAHHLFVPFAIIQTCTRHTAPAWCCFIARCDCFTQLPAGQHQPRLQAATAATKLNAFKIKVQRCCCCSPTNCAAR